MVCCREAPSHYLNQWCSTSMAPYGVSKRQSFDNSVLSLNVCHVRAIFSDGTDNIIINVIKPIIISSDIYVIHINSMAKLVAQIAKTLGSTSMGLKRTINNAYCSYLFRMQSTCKQLYKVILEVLLFVEGNITHDIAIVASNMSTM